MRWKRSATTSPSRPTRPGSTSTSFTATCRAPTGPKGSRGSSSHGSIANSLCFGIYHGEKQVGFARVITDKTTFGYLADVFVLEDTGAGDYPSGSWR